MGLILVSNLDLFYIETFGICLFINPLKSFDFGKDNLFKVDALIESVFFNACNIIRNNNGSQAITTGEHFPSYAGHPMSDGDRCQANTIMEHFIPDAGHTVWNRYGGQAPTMLKCRFPDVGYAVSDGDRCQANTIMERFIPDAGHAVWNLNGG